MFSLKVIELAKRVLSEAEKAGVMVATAESCTGGLVAAALTEIAGSSSVVDRGFVTYSNDAKMQMLGVSEQTLAECGAVSEPTAREMAQGASQKSRAAVTVAVTGIAGPGGGSEVKPVGLVHFAAQKADGSLLHVERRFDDHGRTNIREAALEQALELLIKALAK